MLASPTLSLLLAAAALDSTAARSPDTAATATTTAMAAAPPVVTLPDTLRALGVVVQGGHARGQVLEPAGVAVDAFGRFVVADAALHRLQRFDRDGTWMWETGTLGSDPGGLRRPGSVALLGTLSIAALDIENQRVVTYDLFGHLQGVTIDLADADLVQQVGRVDPVALATDRGGGVFVADQDGERVLVFDFSGRYLRTLGGFGTRAGLFRGLRGLATAPHGELVTAERINARVQRLDAGGRLIGSWPLTLKPGRGAVPIAVDDSSRVAVADETGGTLAVYASDGTLLARLAGLGAPRALAFAADGSLLVAEVQPARVRRFVLERAAPRRGE